MFLRFLILQSIKKQSCVCGDFSMECSQFTGGGSRAGGVFFSPGSEMFANARFDWIFLSDAVAGGEQAWRGFVKISAQPRWTGCFIDLHFCRYTWIVIPNEQRDLSYAFVAETQITRSFRSSV